MRRSTNREGGTGLVVVEYFSRWCSRAWGPRGPAYPGHYCESPYAAANELVEKWFDAAHVDSEAAAGREGVLVCTTQVPNAVDTG